MPIRLPIRSQVLRGISLNRTPGLHFPGNFLDVSFDRVDPQESLLSLDSGPHCADRAGQLEVGALALLADFALASSIRANLRREARLATVSMTLHLTGAPLAGRLHARGEFAGFVEHGAARIGQSKVLIANEAGQQVGFGTGAFMTLAPPANVNLHPVPLRRRGDADPPILAERDLDRHEQDILHRADAALEAGAEGFLRRFWGYVPARTATGAAAVMKNGLHVGNRVGHVQGGINLGLAEATASCALPPHWALASISGWYLRPGVGRALRAKSTVVHHGRATAVVRTLITGRDRKRVMEVMTTHVNRSGG